MPASADQTAAQGGRSGLLAFAPTVTAGLAPPVSGPGIPPPQAPPRGGPPSHEGPPRTPPRRPFPLPLIVALAILVAGGGTVLGLLLTGRSPAQPRSQVNVAALSPRTATTTASVSPPPPTRQQAAQSLSALLAQSATDRSSIENAVSDVSQCGPNLSQDPQTFTNAARSRQALLTELENLPGQSALPAQMLQALTSAWQASIQADQDFAQWAQDDASRGCTTNDQSDPHYQAATAPDDQATISKKSFVSQWNPIATQYGLPTYQWDEL